MLFVDGELKRMLVLCKQRVVLVEEISNSSADIERALDGRLVAHGAEEVLFERENGGHFEEFVAHQELLAGAGDVSVVVQDPHAAELGHMHLQGHVPRELVLGLRLSGQVHSRVHGRGEVVEALVSDMVDHYNYY